MIDIHSHLIPNVDDGSRSVEHTLECFREAKDAGFTDIILTSHYMTNNYETDPNELITWKNKLQEQIGSEVKLHSGMEIYICNELGELIKDKKILTLANSKYILVELPMLTSINYFDYVRYHCETMGLKIIMAHPERYKMVQDNPNIVKEYIDKGCLMQCNFGSITGRYGKEAKKVVKHLLKKDLVHFMASDCHHKGGVYLDIPDIMKKLEKMVGKEKAYEITTLNQQKILNNEDI